MSKGNTDFSEIYDPKQGKPWQELATEAAPATAIGAGAGGIYGLIESALTGKDYLSNTLAKALLGASTAGTSKAYAEADPFQRGGVAGRAYGEALRGGVGDLLSGGSMEDAAFSGTRSALISALLGRGSMQPEQSKSLVQQITQSKIPSVGGWKKRISKASEVAQKLKSGSPRMALAGLKLMTRIMPDMDMRSAAQHGIKLIQSGQKLTPELRNALAALGKRIESGLGTYREATPAFGRLQQLLADYSKGSIDSEELAKNMGLFTGKYGPQTPEAKRYRNFILQALARPVGGGKPSSKTLLGRTGEKSPQLASLVMSALGN